MLSYRAPWPAVALGALVIAGFGANSSLGTRIEHGFADFGASLLLRQVESDVVIVGIDGSSLAELDQWPWPRRYHAELIEKIAPASPKQLFLDIDFSSASNPDDDLRLAKALARWPGAPVVLPAFFQSAAASATETLLTQPPPRLRRHARLASVNLEPSADGLVRSVRRGWRVDGRVLPGAATLLNGLEAAPDAPRQWIDFTIDPASFRYVSYGDVLADRIAAEHFAGKTVLVGATAIELGDNIPVPVHRSLPGVVVQALAYESLRDGPHQAVATWLHWLLLTAATLLLAFLFCRGSWRRNLLLAAGALVAAGAASLLAWHVFAAVVPLVPATLAITGTWLLATVRSLEAETLKAVAYALGYRKRNALLKSIVLSSSDSIICIGADGLIRTANPAAARLFACNPAKLQGSPIFDFLPSLQTGDAAARLFQSLSGAVTECTGRTASGEEFPVELSISRVRLQDERLYTAIVRDVSERQAQQRQLRFQATHDPLTTLPNRPALAARLDSLLAGIEGSRQVALMMIDLDRFKEVNDTLGHNVGDYVLYEVARRLERITADRGFIARIGGDEFALVVDRHTGPEDISQLSQELVDALKVPIETCGVAIDVGLSIGIALYPQNAGDAEALFRHSDVAMYVAKRAGTGFEFYDSSNDRHSVRKLTLVSRLRTAIARDRLQLHYQPQVNLATGRVESAEALLRWTDEELGAVAPDEFIALAETTDLIQPLCRWTLRQALRQSAEWREGGLDLRVAVNLSARMLQDVNFPPTLAELMRDTGVAAHDIELEITESAMMADPQRALQVIGRLGELGAMISIDDYGTGYSSLAYLRDLPVHALKLDKSFVMDMQRHEGNRVIVASTVQMAHALGLQIVAEGVETAGDAAVLSEYGYDYAQGYLYSKALPPEEFAPWVRRFNTASVHELRAQPAG